MKRILIIQTAFLGDVILATALAETLHQEFPGAEIDFLVKKQHASPLNNHPFLKNILLFDRQKNKFSEMLRLLKTIRSEKYDAIINVQRFFSSGFLTAFSGAKIRSGFSKNPMSCLYTYSSKHHLDNIHEIERNHQLISFAGIEKTLMPKVYISDEDHHAVEEYKKSPYICVAPASVWFTKQYPAEKWVEFLDSLPENINVYLLGSEADYTFCNKILETTIHRNSVILCGKLNLIQSASLMKDAIMNYVNDSAPLHIASAMNAPVTAVFCSTVPGFGFGPLSNDSLVIETSEQLSCRPCGLHGHSSCPESHFKCAYTINNKILTDRTMNKLF